MKVLRLKCFPRRIKRKTAATHTIFVATLTLIVLLLSKRENEWVYKCSEDFGYSNVTFQDTGDVISNTIKYEHPFKYIFNGSNTCFGGSEIKMLILVKSAVDNFKKRRIIRRTWAKDIHKSTRRMRIAFLLGYKQNSQIFVRYEHEVNRDIIQEDFIDSYVNNTFKTVMTYNWIATFCSGAKFILLVDDDIYVNIRNVINYVREVENINPLHLYDGHLNEMPIPERNPLHKHYISETDYPFTCYPPYIAGGVVFINQLTASKIKNAIPYIKIFPFDDIFIGIVAQKLSIKPTMNLKVRVYHTGPNWRKIASSIADHDFQNSAMFEYAYIITHNPEISTNRKNLQ